jgi:hypothetical protein
MCDSISGAFAAECCTNTPTGAALSECLSAWTYFCPHKTSLEWLNEVNEIWYCEVLVNLFVHSNFIKIGQHEWALRLCFCSRKCLGGEYAAREIPGRSESFKVGFCLTIRYSYAMSTFPNFSVLRFIVLAEALRLFGALSKESYQIFMKYSM